MHREPNPVLAALANGDIDALLAEHRATFGDAVMTADPAAAAPPVVPAASPVAAPPAAPATGVSFDAQGNPVVAQPATDPAGVWGQGVIPATPPATAAPPVTMPAPQPGVDYVDIGGRRFVSAEALSAAQTEAAQVTSRLSAVEQRLQAEDAARQERERLIREQATAEAAERARQAAETEAARIAGLPLEERLQELDRTWQQKWRERDERDSQRDALEEQERRYSALHAYRSRRIAEESDLIHPTLVDLVATPETGASSEQEIEESIAALKAKTDAIVGTLRDATVAERQHMRGVAPTGAPPSAGPLDTSSGYQQVTSADIAAMDPAEYAKNRPALMEALRRKVSTDGLYGN